MDDDNQSTPPRPHSRARHRTHERPKRQHRVTVRLSAQELEQIGEAASASGLTVTGYVGQAAVVMARAMAAPVAPTLAPLQQELFAARRAVTRFGANVDQAAAAYNATGRLPSWISDAVARCAQAVAQLDALVARINRRLR